MRRHCELFLPRKDGSVMIDHCISYESAKGEWPEEYPMPDVPDDGFEIWEDYWELRRATPSGINGAQSISFSEIDAWKRLYNKNLDVQGVYFIRILDEQYLITCSELNKPTTPKSVKTNRR